MTDADVTADAKHPDDATASARMSALDEGFHPVIIGLTGPIGCGKSTVGAMLAELGGVSIDADALVREVTAPGQPALRAIRERFGDGVFRPSGVLDRAVLAALVFSDARGLQDLEDIVHPGVRVLIDARLEWARRDGDPFVVIEAIKLVEGGLAQRCDEVWLIDCSPNVQRERLSARGMSEEDVERRLAAQGADLAVRLAAHADRRIDTSGTRESVRECVEDALADLLAPRFAGLPWGPVERR
jgi:dephospho-CoA kinase